MTEAIRLAVEGFLDTDLDTKKKICSLYDDYVTLTYASIEFWKVGKESGMKLQSLEPYDTTLSKVLRENLHSPDNPNSGRGNVQDIFENEVTSREKLEAISGKKQGGESELAATYDNKPPAYEHFSEISKFSPQDVKRSHQLENVYSPSGAQQQERQQAGYQRPVSELPQQHAYYQPVPQLPPQLSAPIAYQQIVTQQQTGYQQAVTQQQTGYQQAIPQQPTGLQQAVPQQQSGYQQNVTQQQTGSQQAVPQKSTGYQHDVPQQQTGYQQAVTQQTTGYQSSAPVEHPGYQQPVPTQNSIPRPSVGDFSNVNKENDPIPSKPFNPFSVDNYQREHLESYQNSLYTAGNQSAVEEGIEYDRVNPKTIINQFNQVNASYHNKPDSYYMPQ